MTTLSEAKHGELNLGGPTWMLPQRSCSEGPVDVSRKSCGDLHRNLHLGRTLSASLDCQRMSGVSKERH